MKKINLLNNITILDMGWVIAGPTGTRLLADLGANIIRIETKANFDVIRPGAKRNGVEDPFEEGGWLFQDINRGKKNISLNLRNEKGRKIFNELLKRADAVLCNFSPRAFHKMGLTFEELSKIKSDIIVLNASGMGDYGVHSSYATFAPILNAITGYTSTVAYEGEEPFEPEDSLPDYANGGAIASALLAAIEYRDKTGKGQFIDLAQGETFLSIFGIDILNYDYNKNTQFACGNHDFGKTMSPHNCYKCIGEDDYCVIAAGDNDEWERLRKVVDPKNEWSADERFSDTDSRIKNEKELDNRISEWTLSKTAEEVVEKLQENGVSSGIVQNVKKTYYDEQLKARNFFVPVYFRPSNRTPEKFFLTGMLTGNREELLTEFEPASAVGQDNEEVLFDMLGFTAKEVEILKEEGALE